jgi:hypothetical protein
LAFVIRLAVVFLVLAMGFAFVGFRDILPGVLSLAAKVLFGLLALAGIVCLNVAILRQPPEPDSPAPKS